METLYPVWELFQIKPVTLPCIKTGIFKGEKGGGGVKKDWCFREVVCAGQPQSARQQLPCLQVLRGWRIAQSCCGKVQRFWVKIVSGASSPTLILCQLFFSVFFIQLTFAESPVPSAAPALGQACSLSSWNLQPLISFFSFHVLL